MKKALTITLNNLLFYIEEDAYEKLSAYLESIKKTFASSADRDEIMADIESRIAERFQLATAGAKQAVTIADVSALMASMGTSADFGQEEAPSEPKPLRKFYRDTEHGIIAGVAAGIGAYFGIDPVFVRIAFIISLFAGGLGILIYIILWLVTPAAQTISQKMEMQGDPVTLKNLEEAVKEKIKREPLTASVPGKIADFFRSIFAGIGKVMQSFIPVLRIIFGSIFTLAGVCAFAGITSTTFSFIVNAPTPYMDAEFVRFFLLIPEAYLAPLLGSIFILAIVPVTFLMLLGISLLRNKNTVSSITTGFLISLWMIAIIITGVGASYIAPRYLPEQTAAHYR